MDLVLRLALWAASGIQLPPDVRLYEIPRFTQGLAQAEYNDWPTWVFECTWLEL